MTKESISFEQCVQNAAVTDIGMRRQNNQDAMTTMVAPDLAYWQQRGHLFLVADGMGAHAAGELASKMAADVIVHNYAKRTDASPPEALRQSITQANIKIHEKGMTDAEFQGMGTTCSTLVLLPQGAVVGHVGDSRVYRLRGQRLEQLTFDHSLVWEMRAAGQIKNEAAAIHLPKNIITRSLGPNASVQVDLEGPYSVAVGDTFLLCSDGLTGPVADKELGAILGALPPDEAARTLVDLANLRGGPDNSTVIVVRITGPAIATERDDDETAERGGVHPLLWLVAAVCLVAAVGLFTVGQRFPALLCGIGASVAVIVGFLQKFDRQPPLHDGTPPIPVLGRGPYVQVDCPPSAEFVDALAKLSTEVRAVAEEFGWDVDWKPFSECVAKASLAAERADYAEAIHNHGHALSMAIAELKKRKGHQPISDSQVDLI